MNVGGARQDCDDQTHLYQTTDSGLRPFLIHTHTRRIIEGLDTVVVCQPARRQMTMVRVWRQGFPGALSVCV